MWKHELTFLLLYWTMCTENCHEKGQVPLVEQNVSHQYVRLLPPSFAEFVTCFDFSWFHVKRTKNPLWHMWIPPQTDLCAVWQAIFEIITSEHSYLHSLGILVRHFKNNAALRKTMTTIEHHHLFSNIAVIHQISQRCRQHLFCLCVCGVGGGGRHCW